VVFARDATYHLGKKPPGYGLGSRLRREIHSVLHLVAKCDAAVERLRSNSPSARGDRLLQLFTCPWVKASTGAPLSPSLEGKGVGQCFGNVK
jgi:hypothetical protein